MEITNKKPQLAPGLIEEKVVRSGRLEVLNGGPGSVCEEPGPVLIGRTPEELAQDQNLKVVLIRPPV
jgi:hypothetical protein